MSYEFYRTLHIIGIMLLFAALGGFVVHVLSGGSKRSGTAYKSMMMIHGIGMVLLVLAGFGMIAKLHVPWRPTNWVGIKTGIWLIFGAYPIFIYRRPTLGMRWLTIAILLGAIATWVALYKPI